MKTELESLKKVITKDLEGNINGTLIELLKEDEKTLAYLTTILPGKVKGYYLHKIRECNYICIKGKVDVIIYDLEEKNKQKFTLNSENPQKLKILTNLAAGFENHYEEEAFLINFPNPPYDPEHSKIGERIKYSKEELEKLITVNSF